MPLNETQPGVQYAQGLAPAGKSVEVAVGGGLISATGVLKSQRYNLKQQASNYEKAGDAMACMYRNARLLLDLSPAATDGAPQQLNDRIDEVRAKLRKNQIAVDLVSPDLAGLQTALKGLGESEADLKVSRQNEMQATRQLTLAQAHATNLSRLNLSDAPAAALEAQRLELAKQLADAEVERKEAQTILAKITTCAAAL